MLAPLVRFLMELTAGSSWPAGGIRSGNPLMNGPLTDIREQIKYIRIKSKKQAITTSK